MISLLTPEMMFSDVLVTKEITDETEAISRLLSRFISQTFVYLICGVLREFFLRFLEFTLLDLDFAVTVADEALQVLHRLSMTTQQSHY